MKYYCIFLHFVCSAPLFWTRKNHDNFENLHLTIILTYEAYFMYYLRLCLSFLRSGYKNVEAFYKMRNIPLFIFQVQYVENLLRIRPFIKLTHYYYLCSAFRSPDESRLHDRKMVAWYFSDWSVYYLEILFSFLFEISSKKTLRVRRQWWVDGWNHFKENTIINK